MYPYYSKSAILNSNILYSILDPYDDIIDYEYKVVYCFYNNNTLYLQLNDYKINPTKSYEGFFTDKTINFVLYKIIDTCLTSNNDKYYATVEKISLDKLKVSFYYTNSNGKMKINIIYLNEKKRLG